MKFITPTPIGDLVGSDLTANQDGAGTAGGSNIYLGLNLRKSLFQELSNLTSHNPFSRDNEAEIGKPASLPSTQAPVAGRWSIELIAPIGFGYRLATIPPFPNT